MGKRKQKPLTDKELAWWFRVRGEIHWETRGGKVFPIFAFAHKDQGTAEQFETRWPTERPTPGLNKLNGFWVWTLWASNHPESGIAFCKALIPHMALDAEKQAEMRRALDALRSEKAEQVTEYVH